MSTRPIMIVALAGAIGVAGAGCGGPTKAGIEARDIARKRLAIVNAQLTFDQAQQAFRSGQFEKASREITTAIRLYPESAAYQLLKGRIYLETHRLERALESFEEALELDEELTDAHYYLGVVFQRWSDDAAAYDHYLAAFDIDSTSVAYLLAAAETLVALDDLVAAERLIESRLEYFEHNAALRHLLGRIAMIRDDPAGAARQYADAWRLNPEDLQLLEELALARYDAGQYSRSFNAVKELQERITDDRPDLKHLEARCLASLARLDEARYLYTKLTKDHGENVDLWIELGTVAWELGDFHRMAMCGARVTTMAPKRYEGYMLKGLNERHHGDLREAVLLMRQSAERADETALPLLVLGRILEQMDDPDGALEAYGRALRIEPDSEDAQALFDRLSRETMIVEHPDHERNE